MTNERVKTSILIDASLRDKAKAQRVNISAVCENALIELLDSTPTPSHGAHTHTKTRKDAHTPPFTRAPPRRSTSKEGNGKSIAYRRAEHIRDALRDEYGIGDDGSFGAALLRRIIAERVGADSRTVARYERLLLDSHIITHRDDGTLSLGGIA